jgi:prepilin-type N-terminal cleavage/methylation domain-containing protein
MQKGFSLIELLLAIVIIGFIGLLIANLPNSINLITRGKQSSIAKDIGSQIVEDARASGYDNLANGTTTVSDYRLSSLTGGSASREVDDCPASICKKGEQIKQVIATISWQAGTAQERVNVTTLVSKGGLR